MGAGRGWLYLFCAGTLAASPAISVSGGIQVAGKTVPLLFTWNTAVTVQGSGWAAGESVAITLEGPVNSPGVSSNSIALGTASAGSDGTFTTSLNIPYDQGITGAQVHIPRPGLYAVRGSASSGAVTSTYRISLCPATYTAAGGIDWSRERGTRDGVLPGPLREYSPERSDPEWISVWDNRPAEVYGTISSVTPTGADQRARISYEDDPLAHYAHDINALLTPDAAYRWLVGTANYYQNPTDDSTERAARIEVEWESQNNGTTRTYGSGAIGVPLWATPATGDRVYVMGRWAMDAGHPEIGNRTEIHPARLIAVMRQRPGMTSTGAAAAQVDVYVSGHGGGANRYPSGMDGLLNQGGRGGGRIRDVLNTSDQSTYYRPGPLSFLETPVLNLLIQALTGQALGGTVYTSAGPSAFSWGTPAPEEQPVNDMDYDFDVPLPPAPDGAASVRVEVVTQPQHGTAVTESITYAGAGALPSTAHIHLPYKGADSGIYARTLKFSWNTAAAPRNHFRVRIDRVTVKSTPGAWRLWSEVSGQWANLSNLAPALAQTTQGQAIAIPGAQFDVYLADTDTLRVLVQGYRTQCIDGLFGSLFGMSSYAAGIKLLSTCGPVNNDDLGGALLELPALPGSAGSYSVTADATGQPGGGAFQVDFTVEAATVQTSLECQARLPLAPAISTGGVVGAGLSVPPVAQVSPDGLITIFGQNFAPAGTNRALTGADVQGGVVTSNLGCTCASVNQRLAPVVFVSPGQINIQAPVTPGDDMATVRVIADCSASAQSASPAQIVSQQPVTPQLFIFKLNAAGGGPVAARDAITGTALGASSLGPAFTPARPGEYVALYATGLGVTDPPFAPGVVASRVAQTVDPVSLTLNGVPLAPGDILYAGAAPGYVGLYQINIRIPAGQPDGDVAVVLTINNVNSQAGAFLTVAK